MVRALVVDDHPVIREGVINALAEADIEVVAQAGSRAQARAQIASFNPDLLIMDLHLPDGDCLDLILWVRGISKSAAIVVFTLEDDPNYLLAAAKAGASGYVSKSAPISELVESARHALVSPLAFSASNLLSAINFESNKPILSVRELEVVERLARGWSANQIAEDLYLSTATIKSHVASLYPKLECSNKTSAVTKANSLGLIKI
jgi:DNA-binding NarL/FixJ family response regulator